MSLSFALFIFLLFLFVCLLSLSLSLSLYVSLPFLFKKWASFCLFLFFSNTNFTEKTVGVSWIRTRIVGVEGEHADHLTTTLPHFFICMSLCKVLIYVSISQIYICLSLFFTCLSLRLILLCVTLSVALYFCLFIFICLWIVSSCNCNCPKTSQELEIIHANTLIWWTLSYHDFLSFGPFVPYFVCLSCL